MHKFEKTLFLIVFCLTVSACSSGGDETESTSSLPVVSDDFVSYDMINGVETKHFAELIESVEFTRLEETDESLLGYANNYLIHNDRVIFTSGNEGDIYVFTTTGELVNRINRKGEGPEEYEYVQDMWMEGDSLVIYSRGRYIKWYSLEGDFLKAKDFRIEAGHVIPYRDGYAMDVMYAVLDDSLRFNFAFVDEGLRTRQTHLPAGESLNFRIYTSNSTVNTYKEGILYQRLMGDTTYYFNEEKFSPMVHYNFGNEWYFRGLQETPENIFLDMRESGKYWNMVSTFGDHMVYLSMFGGEAGRNKFLIDRGAGKKVRMDIRKAEPEENYALSVSLWKSGVMYGALASVDIAELIEELEEGQYSFSEGTTLDIIESSENPVLVSITFKKAEDW
ncbi:6-bladed beta-propeller [Roseivirga sp.]|uniref:6-bladed beta-propeller n=1 Tax=Roseivirga sp. TaxID=1964215 RepID=UPI003B519520